MARPCPLKTSSRKAAALGGTLAVVLAFLPSSAAAATPALNQPLPASNYATRAACGTPAPGQASCLALQLVPVTAAARAHTHPLGATKKHKIKAGSPAEGAYGLRPVDLHGAYALPTEASSAQTVGIVDAYNDPTAENDLKTYDEAFSLPACTQANGCFTKVNEEGGSSSLPATEGGWALEISLDIETAHATCQNCRIVLVEASSESYADLEAAEERAVALGATEISNSWGGGEPMADSAAFDHPGVVITASAGDSGYLNWDATEAIDRGFADYPAASPHVVAVGGTRLALKEGTTEWKEEKVWNDGSTTGNGHGASGGGCSERLNAQPWQRAVPDWSEVGCGGARAVADIAADADPYSGVAVYDSTPEIVGHTAPKWITIGGTSLASPLIASAFALAGGANGVSFPAQSLYSNLGSTDFRDVVSGSNGKCTKSFNGNTGNSGCTTAEERASCSAQLICTSASGYDGPTGVGTPDGLGGFHLAAPTVTSVSPSQGITAGGATVTIRGTHLEAESAVEFGGTPASEVNVVSDTELTVKSPPAAAGTVDVTVRTPAGTSATSAADQFTYYLPLPPVVTSVSPPEGTTNGGATVTIKGTNLEGASAVDFGAQAASQVHVISPTEITAKSPAGSAGAVDVTISTPGGTSASAPADRFTYVLPPAPTVSSLSPNEGTTAGGTEVTITGTNMEAATGVEFDGVPAAIIADSANSITVETPPHAAATVDVTVVTASGESATSGSDLFTFRAPPKGRSASSSLPEEGGTSPHGIDGETISGELAGSGSSASSSFRLLGKPRVNARTGALTVKVSLSGPGTLDWLVTFKNGTYGVFAQSSDGTRCKSGQVAFGNHCWPARVVFAQGAETAAGSRTVTIVIKPNARARRALRYALRHGRALPVAVAFSYGAPGAAPTQSASVGVRLRRAHSTTGTV